MAVDIAYGAGDYVAAPVCYQFADEFYIVDAIFDDGDKFITRPRIRDKILEHKIQAVQFEGTVVNSDYEEWIDKSLRDKGYRANLTMKPASTRQKKEYRIRDRAPEIKELYFLESDYRDKEYQKFMQNVFSFKLNGKNKHEDAPDSLAQLCDMRGGSYAVCEAFARPF
jgi:predicted phage terminase large subunit-like protein